MRVTEEELDILVGRIDDALHHTYELKFYPNKEYTGDSVDSCGDLLRVVLEFRETTLALNAACGFAFDVGREREEWRVRDERLDWILGCCQQCEENEAFEDKCTREKPSCHRHLRDIEENHHR